MQTTSHLLLTAFAGQQLKGRWPMALHLPALLWGSVLPDLPFTILTLLGEAWFLWFKPLPSVGSGASVYEIMVYLHFDRFFRDPLWIVSHNFFHSFIINGLLVGVGWWMVKSHRGGGLFLFWLAVGALAHTVIDIFTHSSDGPLFLFPLNWTYRFASPISYWEASSYGIYFVAFEWLLDAIIIVYFAVGWFRRQRHTA